MITVGVFTELGLTKKELSRLLGCSSTQMRRWEIFNRGEIGPKFQSRAWRLLGSYASNGTPSSQRCLPLEFGDRDINQSIPIVVLKHADTGRISLGG